MERIRAEVNEKVVQLYAEKLFDSIAEMGSGFGEAADGATKLLDGSAKLANGSRRIERVLLKRSGSAIT